MVSATEALVQVRPDLPYLAHAVHLSLDQTPPSLFHIFTNPSYLRLGHKATRNHAHTAFLLQPLPAQSRCISEEMLCICLVWMYCMCCSYRLASSSALQISPSRLFLSYLKVTKRLTRALPNLDQNTFSWAEQLRTRAESSVSGQRPSFSFASSFSTSPPRANFVPSPVERARPAVEMQAPPAQAAAVKPKQPERRKPDPFQERILKGDFYMD